MAAAEGGIAIPADRVARGRLRPPASKSQTQRALNLALLSGRSTTLLNPLVAEDTRLYLQALERLGCGHRFEAQRLILEPTETADRAELWCGDNGTQLRFLTAALSVLPGLWRLDGSDRLRQRPVGPLVEALRQLGASIEFEGEPGFAPLRIEGGGLSGETVRLDARQSSQFASALLMAATRLEAPIVVLVDAPVSVPYLDLTLQMTRRFGAEIESLAGGTFRVHPSLPGCAEVEVEVDFSAAAYPAAAAFLTGGDVTLEGVNRDSLQADRQFLDILREMGARVTWGASQVRIEAGSGPRAVDVDLGDLPDQVPTLAAIAPFARGKTIIRNVAHLRLKESDRLAAMQSELGRLGARVDDRPDGLEIEGTWDRGHIPREIVRVASHGDHRIAMSLALVGLRRPGVIVRNPEVVRKSYPAFWRDLEGLLQG